MTGSAARSPSRERTSFVATRAWQWVLVVPLLTIGVIAMHSFGVGHHTASLPGQAAAVGVSASHHAPDSTADGHGTPAMPIPLPDAAADGCPSCRAVDGTLAGIEGSGLTAVCLAILPVLFLALRGRWPLSFRRVRRRRADLATGVPIAPRGEPWGVTSPSLSKLCLLRT